MYAKVREFLSFQQQYFFGNYFDVPVKQLKNDINWTPMHPFLMKSSSQCFYNHAKSLKKFRLLSPDRPHIEY